MGRIDRAACPKDRDTTVSEARKLLDQKYNRRRSGTGNVNDVAREDQRIGSFRECCFKNLLSRLVICGVIAAALGPLLLQITNPFLLTLDVLFRTYVMFLGTVMAHEGTHGHLGATKASNFWWGRLALLPALWRGQLDSRHIGSALCPKAPSDDAAAGVPPDPRMARWPKSSFGTQRPAS